MRQLTQIIVLVVLGIFWGVSNEAWAAHESRCTELGANCICSEPLNTNSWIVINTWGYNPADTTGSDKECRNEGVAGVAYFSTDPTGAKSRFSVASAATDPAIFTALPQGNTVTYVWRSPTGEGTGVISNRFRIGTDPFVRQGIRFYRYYSSDFTFTGPTPPDAPLCNSLKIMQMGSKGNYSGGPMFQGVGNWAFYDFSTSTGWSASVDCCGEPKIPGQAASLPTRASVRGKWIRFEGYIVNNTTSGTTSNEWYMKNVTDNTPEVRIADTAGAAQFAGVHPASPMIDFSVNGFRSNNGNACGGYFAHSHFLAAAWTTNAGQRIGAAVEIEAGGSTGDTAPPVPPTNLKISMTLEEDQ